MKRKTILKLWNTLTSMENVKHDVRFSYFIAKNKVSLKDEVSTLESIKTPSEEFLEYESLRISCAEKLADKDIAGNPKISNGQYIISENKDEFEKQMESLKKKFDSVIDTRKKQLEEYTKMLDEDVEVNLSKIKVDHLLKEVEPVVLEVFIEANIINN